MRFIISWHSRLFWLVWALLVLLSSWAQESPVEIRHADRLHILRIGGESVQTAAGNVRIFHDSTLLEADSIVHWTRRRILKGWGHIHITTQDTIRITADSFHYSAAARQAQAWGEVQVRTPTMHLHTDAVMMDLGGRVVTFPRPYQFTHPQFTLSARRGRLYTGSSRFDAADSVVVQMRDGDIRTSSLHYFHADRRVVFPQVGCLTSARTRLHFQRGAYQFRRRKGAFAGGIEALSGRWHATADSLALDDSTGRTQWYGHVIWRDTAGTFTAAADSAVERGRFRQGRLIGRAVVRFTQQSDSVWLAAPRMAWTHGGARWHAAGGVTVVIDSMGLRADSVWGDTLRGIWRFFPIIMRYGPMLGVADSAAWWTHPDSIALYGHIWIRQQTPLPELHHQLQARRGTLLLAQKRLRSGLFHDSAAALYYFFDDSNRIVGYSRIGADSVALHFGSNSRIERFRFSPTPRAKVFPPPTDPHAALRLTYARPTITPPPVNPAELFLPEILVILQQRRRDFIPPCPF